ncbi:MAG: hypothetical protein ACRC67_08420 [Inquilinus sp.]|uniref:hypothetical protein n=1 Tax=Inquilinus sp. TaxID=1932117 RepID=UPI003F37C957
MPNTPVNLQRVINFADLRAITPSGSPLAPAILSVDGYETAGDGGGLFRWDPSSNAGDNDGTIIKPTNIPSSGRWSRILEGGRNYDFRWFGAKGDGRTVITNATISTGSTDLTTSAGPFSSADVNKVIWVPGAGPGGGILISTVAQYNTSTNVTLSVPASTSLTNAPTTIILGYQATSAMRDITINTGSSVLTSATSVFSAADVKKLIFVPGAGPAGGVLISTIETVTSGTQIILSDAAATSLTAVSTNITLGPLDTQACQNTIDAAMVAGVGVEFSCGDYLVGPLKGNGSNWDSSKQAGQQPAVLSFRGQGRSPFLCRLIAAPGAYGGTNLKAVLTFRNVVGVTISNFQIDAYNVAETCGDFAFIGNGTGSVAPSCKNEFTHLWGQNAKKIGWNLDQAADSKVSAIQYEGGTAPIGLSFKLHGGGIWADNIFLGTGKLLTACQNAGFQNCGFFDGVELADDAYNFIHFDSCHLYPFKTIRENLVNPLKTKTWGDDWVEVAFPNHGLVVGNYVVVPESVTAVGGISKDNLKGTRRIVGVAADGNRFWFLAGEAAATEETGGGTLTLTGRGYAVYSAAEAGTVGSMAIKMTACWFNIVGVPEQRYFAGRWYGGVHLDACRFGSEAYFDTDHNWSIAVTNDGVQPPVFWFDNCFFPNPKPISVENKVLVGFRNRIDEDGSTFKGIETPGDLKMPRSGYDRNRLQMGASSMWEDTVGLPRWAPNDLMPSGDGDGEVMMLRQTGLTSPLGSVVPRHRGAQYYDQTANTIWWAMGPDKEDWLPVNDRGANITLIGSTLDLATSTGDYIEITGAGTINAFGIMNAGIRKTLRFGANVTLTHNATSLIIPGATNLVVTAGSVVQLLSLGAGNWAVTGFSDAGFNASVLSAGTIADARLPSSMANKTLAGAVVTPVATTIALLPAASSSNANQLRVVTDGAASKRLVISDGAGWRYMDGGLVS